MSIRLNDLKNFIECASRQTLSEGARSLGISQPALSESISRLESDLEGTLFYRSKNGIALTPTGKSTLEKAKQIFNLLQNISDSKGSEAGAITQPVVTIGCHPVVASYILPQSLSELQKSVPNYRVQIKHGLSREMQREIQAGNLDLGIIINPISNPDLVIRRIGKDTVTVFRSPSPNQDHDTIFCDLDLFQTQDILRRWKKRPEKIVQTSSLELIARLTNQGLGYGIIPARVVDLLGFKLTAVQNTPRFEDEIAVLHRPEFGKTDYERRVLKSLHESLH